MTWPRMCGATRRDGQPCGNYAITGARTCRMHGSATRAAREAARWRHFMWRAEAKAATLADEDLAAMFPLDPQVEEYLAATGHRP